MPRVAALIPLLLAVALVACGGGDKPDPPSDPVNNIPSENGIRQSVEQASLPDGADFPIAEGKTLAQLADTMTAGPELALASSIFVTPGPSRMAFGMIDGNGAPVYGPTVIYVAPTPDAPAEGPYPAPADVLMTEPRYRSEQAAKTEDPFVAVYAAEPEFAKRGPYAVLAATKRSDGVLTGATANITVSSKGADPIPAVGDRAPKVHTDTIETAKGDVSNIDTRLPPSDMHNVDFADVVGKRPVALLFATPQLCASKVCGPVTDIELQMKSSYGDEMDFIHQEVYVDNDATKGLRQPLKEFSLPTEPWLFVVDKSGKITARLEGSIGVKQFEDAVKSGL